MAPEALDFSTGQEELGVYGIWEFMKKTPEALW